MPQRPCSKASQGIIGEMRHFWRKTYFLKNVSRFGRIHLSLFTSHLSPYIYRARTQKEKLNFFTQILNLGQNGLLMFQKIVLHLHADNN